MTGFTYLTTKVLHAREMIQIFRNKGEEKKQH